MKYVALALVFLPYSAMAATGSELDLATTVGSLLFVVALIFLLAWALKRMRVPTMMNQKGLSIVRQIPVGTKERVMIIEAGKEQFLVGVTTQSIQLISKLDTPITQEELASGSFANQMSQLLKKNDQS
ncbi:flagellar biosynthetic protein FliO [Vibrio genomosp. F10]|uniref:Flagellar protein n=2 Tax=Vibrio genomosp. F10 TaxID=723171 RepID=A0A1B9QWR0_9VIBR|nr:flagellar biosynthetic protein FliO [Vibrio genomosp. F10]OCH74123.1 flagellar biosynthetic protein FliO [Vibrio genomosp. F10]OEE35398.1 flagellar biosynthetic protein FliO [Vibrio genomosp. F10 str. ZF-129]OEE93699.1 flagellar biosynthetic protein FliO [Vibrio genomosp. F10 str. 9ZD137]OEE94448.1 flagellar biosynthetic protein FliO [Vibrio genomosp. F10 str. 9ZC157]OEF04678.1 flagellar biosynthetic protein FliO [Vibrio genomosp. F10 str. 9ZB36]